MLERNYRAQQDFEQRNRNPHYINQAIQQVESPILTTEPPKNHKVLRANIKQLKKSQKEHFNIDEDEHPARQSYFDDVEEVTRQYKNLNQFRDEESHYDRLQKQSFGNGDSQSSKYEQTEPKQTNFYDEIDDSEKYGHGEFVTPTSYQNYNNGHNDDQFEIPNFSKYENHDDDDDDDNYSNQPSSKYSYHENSKTNDENSDTFNPYQKNIDSYGAKRYITNEEVKEFDKYLRSKPRYIAQKRTDVNNQNEYNDRSDKGVGSDFVPYKMLASVRHSEKFEHQPKDFSNPMLKERILEKGGHVVYTEQGYQDQQFDHGNEDKFANVKHRRRRHVSEDRFPFYHSPTRRIPKHSAIRYAENGEHLRSGSGKVSLYNTKRKVCDDVEFDETNVNDKETDFREKKRLTGLEDKIDCMKEKLFGAEPLGNPIFQEHFVDEILPIVKPRRTRISLNDDTYRTSVNIFDDVTRDIEGLSSTHNEDRDHTASGSNVDYVVFPPYLDIADSKMTSKNISILDIVANETSNHDHPPVVILMDEDEYSQLDKKKSLPKYTEFFKYPRSDGTEVFIFDISKFFPKFVLPEIDEEPEESATAEQLEVSTNTPKKSSKMKLKMRRHQKKTLDSNSSKHLPRRHTNVYEEGTQLANQPFILPGSYDLHEQGNTYR